MPALWSYGAGVQLLGEEKGLSMRARAMPGAEPLSDGVFGAVTTLKI